MTEDWEKRLACANVCSACAEAIEDTAKRILSVYSHEPICMACKQLEEKRPDYEDAAKKMMADCIESTGRPYGDVGGYCFHHFCPFKC